MTIGKAIRIVRSIRGLSQKQLAERVNCDHSYISLLESGKREPSWATLNQISASLQITTARLVDIAAASEDALLGVD